MTCRAHATHAAAVALGESGPRLWDLAAELGLWVCDGDARLLAPACDECEACYAAALLDRDATPNVERGVLYGLPTGAGP